MGLSAVGLIRGGSYMGVENNGKGDNKHSANPYLKN